MHDKCGKMVWEVVAAVKREGKVAEVSGGNNLEVKAIMVEIYGVDKMEGVGEEEMAAWGVVLAGEL